MRSPPAADVAVSTNVLASGWLKLLVCWSSVTGMKATVSLALMFLAPSADVYGLTTRVTWGRASIFVSMWAMRPSMTGSVTLVPPEVANTMSSVSPEIFGAADWSNEMASVDCVCGSEKEFEYAEPTVFPRTEIITRTTNQIEITSQRWRTHHPASVRIVQESPQGRGGRAPTSG